MNTTNGVVKIGNTPWTRQEMIASLEEFTHLYHHRPFQDNSGGMKSPHMFLFWFLLRTLKPQVVIESGVWKGQGTWLIENACPTTQIHCIEINPKVIQYRSKRALYHQQDFSRINWNNLPEDHTLLFFDDHQNSYHRIIMAKWFGFKHLVFEDNYPVSQGNCYSPKKIFANAGFMPENTDASQAIPPNDADAQFLIKNTEIYNELPPVFKLAQTRWNDPWDDVNYPTPQPLLDNITQPWQQIFLQEAIYYTWMCYLKLK